MSTRGKFEEVECKFLEVNPKTLEKKLLTMGAVKKFERLFRRYVLDFPDLRLNANNAWLRVRDEGDRVTVGYKQRLNVRAGKQDGGMKEVEIIVNSFDDSVELFKSLGMTPKFYEENRRTLFELDGVEVAIDEWPLIPPYVEIEGDSWDDVDTTAQRLGFNPAEKLICATMQVYERYGIDEMSFSKLTFDEQVKKS